MKLYKIVFNENDYDQYDAFVVRAQDEAAVEELIRKKYPEKRVFPDVDWSGGFTIKEISQEGEEEEILGSFNAG